MIPNQVISAEAYLGPYQTYMMEIFATIVTVLLFSEKSPS